MDIEDRLKAAFRHEELQVCAAIGAKAGELSGKIQELFDVLIDPLLSRDEIKVILSTPDTDDAYTVALDTLCRDGVLEASDTTQRPLDDEEGLKLFRKKLIDRKRLKLIAVETKIDEGHARYQFTFDGRLVRSLAKVDRLDAIAGRGNQRNEIKRHVANIAEGVKAGIQVPNAILLTLNESNCVVDPDSEDTPPESFIVIRGISESVDMAHPLIPTQAIQSLRSVEIDFPFRPAAFDDEKAALLVDGQQRTAALSLVPVDSNPVVMLSVIALIAEADEAKKIFQIANSTQKITTEFSRALLASMDEDEAGYLREEQARARACKLLALERQSSPFKNIVRYPGVARSVSQVVAYNSIFQIVTKFAESSLEIEKNSELLAETVEKCFIIVSEVWPEAWGKRPTHDSRLMHGASLRSLAALCTELLAGQLRQNEFDLSKPVWDELRASLERLRTNVLWDSSALSGNKTQAKNYREVISAAQNTNQSIAEMTSFLSKESLAVDQAAKKK